MIFCPGDASARRKRDRQRVGRMRRLCRRFRLIPADTAAISAHPTTPSAALVDAIHNPHRERPMSTFYILPSRALLGQRFAEFLTSVFPGLEWQRPQWTDLAEAVDSEVLRHSDVFAVY